MDHRAFAQLLGNYGEFVGAIAVVVTLVYLSRQIAMSNKLAKADAWRSRFSEFTSLNAAYGVNTAFYYAMKKLYNGDLDADLNDAEKALANSFIISVLQMYEQFFREVRTGILDSSALDEFPGHSVFVLPYFREQWPFYRNIATPLMLEHMREKHGLG